MTVFVDTSALLAVLDADDESHARADGAWRKLLGTTHRLATTNYVLVETFALAQSRLGIEAVRALEQDLIPALEVTWVDAELHKAASTQRYCSDGGGIGSPPRSLLRNRIAHTTSTGLANSVISPAQPNAIATKPAPMDP